MEPVRRSVELSNCRVSYLAWEPTEIRRTVLLLHGGGVDSASLSWAGVGPRLAADGHRVIAVDHPGYGHSELPRWTSSQRRLLDYVAEFADSLTLDGYVVGGLSLGGGLALGHVLERPERVAGVMLLGSYGLMPRFFAGRFGRAAHWLTWAMVRTGLLEWLTAKLARDPKQLERSFDALIRTPSSLTPQLKKEVAEATARGEGMAAFAQWQRDQVGPFGLRADYTDSLGGIGVPVLIVHGDHDPGVPVEYARRAARAIPNSTLVVVPGAAHWVQRDRPDVVIPAMLEFCGSLA